MNSEQLRYSMCRSMIYIAFVGMGVLAHAQHFKQFNFSGQDGSGPQGGLVTDQLGNLYGTTNAGGSSDVGVVYELSPNPNGTVTQTVLYNFTGSDGDGANPVGDLVFSEGNLYGVTQSGGTFGQGTVFELSPSGGEWQQSILYSFQGSPSDGSQPKSGLIIDNSGNLYGTASQGGIESCNGGCGTVFQLSPPMNGEEWSETNIYFFQGVRDGEMPLGALTLDSVGNLYGTTYQGGYQFGTVFELSPPIQQGPWLETVLHRFTGLDGGSPAAGLAIDSNGSLYGTTTSGQPPQGQGTVFRLTPPKFGGMWRFGILYNLAGESFAPVTLGPSNSLFGTTVTEGGTVFELRFSGSKVTFSTLFSFGELGAPRSKLLLLNGALYSTTDGGGYKGNGGAFQLRP